MFYNTLLAVYEIWYGINYITYTKNIPALFFHYLLFNQKADTIIFIPCTTCLMDTLTSKKCRIEKKTYRKIKNA